MATRVRSYSKINLGLAIGPPRPDGFHGLVTLYQTLRLHDVVTVAARTARRTRITLTCTDLRVPRDARNTAWQMVEVALETLRISAEVRIHIEKNLPIQGGMGAGSANAAAALIGLKRELGFGMAESSKQELAARVGSDVPLFLVGGAVLGTDRGQQVAMAPEVRLAGSGEIWCVVALPGIGVSTPAAFRDWDRRFEGSGPPEDKDLHNPPISDTLDKLSRTYASVFAPSLIHGLGSKSESKSGASGIVPEPSSSVEPSSDGSPAEGTPEKLQVLAGEQLHPGFVAPEAIAPEAVGQPEQSASGFKNDLAGNTLLALVRTGIENDFETVVFPQYPFLGEIKRHLLGASEKDPNEHAAIYAALSGSGSALFGLYRTEVDARAAQQRLQVHGVKALVTTTLPRPLYWSEMFAR